MWAFFFQFNSYILTRAMLYAVIEIEVSHKSRETKAYHRLERRGISSSVTTLRETCDKCCWLIASSDTNLWQLDKVNII